MRMVPSGGSRCQKESLRDESRFDALARVLSTSESRRRVLTRVAALPVLSGLAGVLSTGDVAGKNMCVTSTPTTAQPSQWSQARWSVATPHINASVPAIPRPHTRMTARTRHSTFANRGRFDEGAASVVLPRDSLCPSDCYVTLGEKLQRASWPESWPSFLFT